MNPAASIAALVLSILIQEPKGSSWRVFAVDTLPVGPVAIVQVEELRQQKPPSTWAVSIVNRSFLPVESVTLAAAVVDSTGMVKAIQPLPAIENLKPSQVRRRQMRIRGTALAPTDRVVFFIDQALSETTSFKARTNDVSALIRLAAMRMPVP